MADFVRFQNIVGFETPAGQRIGWHSENMQVAELDAEAWEALTAPQSPSDSHSSAAVEMLAWNNSEIQNASTHESDSKIRSLSINVAQICNLRCTYCFAGDGTYGATKGLIDTKKTKWQIEKTIEKLENGERFEIRFFGGEPLLHMEALHEIVPFAKTLAQPKEIDLVFEVITNGTLVTPEIAEFLAQHNFGITVSFDGPAEIQNKSRPAANKSHSSSEKLETGVSHLIKFKESYRFLRSKTVVGAHNLDFLNSFRYSEKLGFPLVSFTFASTPRDGQMNPLYNEKLTELFQNLYAEGGEQKLRMFDWIGPVFDQLDEGTKKLNFCNAGRNAATLNTENDWYACHALTENKKFQIGTAEVGIHDGYRAAYTADHVEKPKCSKCPIKYLCGGGCFFVHYSQTGDAQKPDLNYCERQKSFYRLCLEYYLKVRNPNQEEKDETHQDCQAS